MLTATDPLSQTTTNSYDTNGNLLSVTTPSPDGSTAASVTSFTYASNGELTRITDPLSNQTNIAYYSTGMFHTITDAQSNVTTYAYDARGNRTSVTDAASNLTQFQYDSMNRLTKITYPNSSTVQFAYDTRGRRTSVTDQNSKVTQYAYDDADRLTSVTDAASNQTQYTYDTENNLTDIYDAASNHTHFDYIVDHQLQKTTFPSGHYEQYSFDPADNLVYKWDRKNQQLSLSRDAQNRVIRRIDSGNTVYYTYDADGRLTQAQDGTGTYGFTFDNMSRLTQTSTNYTFLTARGFTTQYAYDAASNRTTLTDPESGATHYTYDTLNRLTGLNDFQSHNFTFSYDALSRRTQLTRPNGINTNYSYDNVSHLLSVLHQLGSTTVDGASYTYDSAGNRTAKTDHASSVTSNYGYDAIYQLTGVSQGSTTTESYTYDAVGNRLSSLGMSSYNYNSSNQLTSTPSATYTYDNNGSTVTKVDSTGTVTYTWDYVNQLSSVALPGSGGSLSFKYDPFGRRIQKSSASGTRNYLYDGPNLLEEVDNSGNVLARYTQSPGIDQPLAELRSGTTSYYQQDALSSVSSLSNSAAGLANTYTYDSYGKLTASTGTISNPSQYTGREFDQETTISFYRSRYYDASVGRFISEDSIEFAGGNNFYRYVLNTPTNFADPLGLAPNCSMTTTGLVCDSNYAVDYQIAVLGAIFPGSSPQGASLVVHMSCNDVSRILANSDYYTGGFWSVGNWLSQNPFLFSDIIAHSGGSEWRNRSGFHFRMKYNDSKCDKNCTLDQFHIDDHNPMYDPWGHFINDIPKLFGLGK